MPAWAVWALRGLAALFGGDGDSIVKGLLICAAVFLLPFALIMAVVYGILAWGTPTPLVTGALPPGTLAQWVPPVLRHDSGSSGIPTVLTLAVMHHESGGDWQAHRINTNGTEDAGLMQVNSSQWSRYGIAGDPFGPRGNLAAGIAILEAAARVCGSTVTPFGQTLTAKQETLALQELMCALETYNGWGSGYEQAVLDAVPAIEGGAHVAVRPLGDVGDGTAAALPRAGEVTFVVTAYAPWGYPPEMWDGMAWPGIELPVKTAAYASGGRPVSLAPCAAAPKDVARWLPPDSGCQYATVKAPPGEAAQLTVIETFVRTEMVTDKQGRTVPKRIRVNAAAQSSAMAGPAVLTS